MTIQEAKSLRNITWPTLVNLQAKDINSSIFGAKWHAQNATTGSRKLKMVAGSLKKGGEVALSDHPKSVSDCNHLHNIAFKSCREINKLTPTLEVALVVFFRFSTILKKIRKKASTLNDIMNNLQTSVYWHPYSFLLPCQPLITKKGAWSLKSW